jgi:hypothetical protein
VTKLRRDETLRALDSIVRRAAPQPQQLPGKPRRAKTVMRPRASLPSIMHCAACGAVGNAGPTCASCGEPFKKR